MIKQKKKYASQSKREAASLVSTYIILTILALIWIVPIVWIVLSALRKDVGIVSPDFFPKEFGFENFRLCSISSTAVT